MKDEASIVKQIVRRHGEIINLKDNPAVIIDILRRFGGAIDDGGSPPGGAPTPPPPPGPTSLQSEVSNAELMKEILKVSRAIALLQKKAVGR